MFSQVYKGEAELLQLLTSNRKKSTFFQVQGTHLGSGVDGALFHHLTDTEKNKIADRQCLIMERPSSACSARQKNSCVEGGAE